MRYPLNHLTAATITEPYKLTQELEKIRQQGYAETFGQRIEGAVGLAAPFWRSGEVIGSVCITIPDARFDRSSERKLAELLLECAGKITDELSGPSPDTARPQKAERKGASAHGQAADLHGKQSVSVDR
jgi:DNA-binding IclR family transcriptional regulator